MAEGMATFRFIVSILVFVGLTFACFASPAKKGKFLFGDGELFQRITTMPQNTSQQQAPVEYPFKFVPLISFIAEFLKIIIGKLGLINGFLNKFPIKNPMRENITQEVTVAELDDDEEDETEDESEEDTYLLECDAAHLGLWPDKSNSQRYYKCEVDPRTPSLGNCLQDYFRERAESKANATSQEGLFVPLVRPCFMLTVMKCANGFKYSHKARVCIPDVIFN